MSKSNPVYFYGKHAYKEYFPFSNFYDAPLLIDGKWIKTSEHKFQSDKYIKTDPYWAQIILSAETPTEAKRLGGSRGHRIDYRWEEIKDDVMYECVLKKFTQYSELKKLLLSTGNREIFEHTKNDSYWGDGLDGSGRNQLGITLMRVRKELREEK